MIQNFILWCFQKSFKLLEILLPPVAGKWAAKLFFSPRRFKSSHKEIQLMKNAEIFKKYFRSDFKMRNSLSHYFRYSWGSGPVVLLVHGWGSRGSKMAFFVEPLINKGYCVVTFDAVAHGNSHGKRTNMLEFAHIIKDIQKDMGKYHAIIGHSLGGMAAAYAVREGVITNKLITIASPATIEFIFESFAKQINPSEKTIRKLKKYLQNFTGKNVEEFSLINILIQLDIPGLLIHDKHDKEVPFTQALLLHKNWLNSRIILTERLGHRRIIRDTTVISKILDYLDSYQNHTSRKHTHPISRKLNHS